MEQSNAMNNEVVTKKKISPKAIAIAAIPLIAISVGLFFIFRGPAATGIVLYEDTIELIAGNTKTLRYEILPNNARKQSIEWRSSEPLVATVSKTGEVTAIGEGEAVIMITTPNGKVDECLVIVRPTAFDYLKQLGLGTGYTVGNYTTSNGVSSIGLAYRVEDDSLYIMENNEFKSTTNGYGSSFASIAIPSSLLGEYKGLFEYDSPIYFSEPSVVESTYLVDAATFTRNTDLHAYTCNTSDFRKSSNDEMYTACVRAILVQIHKELLEPNGYTYSDLGFYAFS